MPVPPPSPSTVKPVLGVNSALAGSLDDFSIVLVLPLHSSVLQALPVGLPELSFALPSLRLVLPGLPSLVFALPGPF